MGRRTYTPEQIINKRLLIALTRQSLQSIMKLLVSKMLVKHYYVKSTSARSFADLATF